MKDFDLEFYRKFAENLYPPFSSDDGIDLEEIRQAEKSYGFLLPKILRDFFLLAGNHKAINDSHNRLLSVDCLEIEDNKLIFYQENQAACCWAIDLSDIEKDDPPVWIGQSIAGQEKLEWYVDFEKLTDFLLVMLCWQSVMGGLGFTGIASGIKESVVETTENNFRRLEVGKNGSGLQIFIDGGKLVCLSESEDGTNIDAGASDEEKFLEIEDLLHIEWDYCSRDDD